MGRLSLSVGQSLRTRFFYEFIKKRCDLSDGQLDMLFREPLHEQPNYYDRRRIFNRMKHGYMPYRGTQRDAFINRVGNYRRLDITASAYNSALWEMIDVSYSSAHNESILLKCIMKLGLYSDNFFNQALNAIVSINTNHSSAHNFDLSGDDLSTYEESLETIFLNCEYSLDILAFIAALYRESLYYGKPDLATVLRNNYALKLINFCTRYGISSAIRKEMIEVSINKILTINNRNNFGLLDKMKIEGQKTNKQVDRMLKSFLLFHEYLLTGKHDSE